LVAKRRAALITYRRQDIIQPQRRIADSARLAIALKDTWDFAQIVQFSLGSPGGGRMAGAQMGS
jgi:hypothetical protein